MERDRTGYRASSTRISLRFFFMEMTCCKYEDNFFLMEMACFKYQDKSQVASVMSRSLLLHIRSLLLDARSLLKRLHTFRYANYPRSLLPIY